ncbi:hypothetical protein REJC140_02525 [Pseudorhizobium endolithicum]|uniref:DUF1214 domain-containing protein n=1 Tax=Pseudorhizobium endolithicum TaxID=1191678 RepID=A0ABN7JKK4_9HYPH|nr:DUF1214 domain-containing protein [Pseudorhizobium endolithicum]CAD6421373.1 hypothetical protein REQ54_02219 [Rhizobium sp. Q54]CAD7027630.1 hypothetical protein REJC140_02525 [Pseudorhizobium endolithicum]
MFRVPFLVAIALAIAFGGGIWSTLWALEATAGFGAIRLGAWEAFPNAQTADADPYAKSHRASAGALLYASAEGLRFTANVDDAGAALDADCSYRISGHTPPARLWTLHTDRTAAARKAERDGLPVAVNSRTILRRADGTFDIVVSRFAQPGNWLSVNEDGRFRLRLTLLDTPAAGSSGLIDLSMPSITNTGCRDA